MDNYYNLNANEMLSINFDSIDKQFPNDLIGVRVEPIFENRSQSSFGFNYTQMDIKVVNHRNYQLNQFSDNSYLNLPTLGLTGNQFSYSVANNQQNSAQNCGFGWNSGSDSLKQLPNDMIPETVKELIDSQKDLIVNNILKIEANGESDERHTKAYKYEESEAIDLFPEELVLQVITDSRPERKSRQKLSSDELKRKRRESNRKASLKCKQKKLNKAMDLETRIQCLTEENAELERRLKELRVIVLNRKLNIFFNHLNYRQMI